MVKAIIFDMDGVIFDTESFYFQRRIDFLLTKGLSVSHLKPSFFIGGRAGQVWQRILGDDYEKWDVPVLEEEYRIYKENRPTPYAERVFPDVKSILERLSLHPVPLVLASNTDRIDIERALKETGIRSYFSQIYSAMDCVAPKPDPAVYEQAAKATGVPKSDILVFEDSAKGIEAAKAAGLTVWAIRDQQFGMDQSKADKLVDSLEQALEWLQL
ncbi:HAD family phosphatase [Streptococcus parasuis]|uniref:HAD family hydrolase n=1 Tax=Streptococcus parasuis TaxID=1501662 RepID=UPI0029645990|nr:HAD family phosphatase [Streptococcus parasuis]